MALLPHLFLPFRCSPFLPSHPHLSLPNDEKSWPVDEMPYPEDEKTDEMAYPEYGSISQDGAGMCPGIYLVMKFPNYRNRTILVTAGR